MFTYQSLLERPVGVVADDVRAAAAYGLGEAALRDGQDALAAAIEVQADPAFVATSAGATVVIVNRQASPTDCTDDLPHARQELVAGNLKVVD